MRFAMEVGPWRQRWLAAVLAAASMVALSPAAGLAQTASTGNTTWPKETPAAVSTPSTDADKADPADDNDDAEAASTEKKPQATDGSVSEGNTADTATVDPATIDWSQLNVDASTLAPAPPPKAATPGSSLADNGGANWSSSPKGSAASAVSVKRSLLPFWDARVGADMTVVREPQVLTGADLLRQKVSPDGPSDSTGTAWAAITAPGVAALWDKTAVEARLDPTQEQSKIGTSISKALPLSPSYSLSLQDNYNLIQQGAVPIPGIPGRPVRSYETEQSAKLSLTDFGTSFTAAQALSSTDDKWLRSFGAEQKLYGGVSITGSVGETSAGTATGKISAGYKKSW